MEMLPALLTNRAVMSRRVWEQTLGMKEVPEPLRGVVRSVEGLRVVDSDCSHSALVAAVQLTNGGGRTASNTQIIEAEQLGLISFERDQNDSRKILYNLAEGVAEKLVEIDRLERKVSLVLVVQSSNPDDFDAGRDELPEGIYFNFRDPKSQEWMRARVAEIEAENRAAKIPKVPKDS